jgi:hypothetical protein
MNNPLIVVADTSEDYPSDFMIFLLRAKIYKVAKGNKGGKGK